MAIRPETETEFVGKINAGNADYPLGSARDITTPGDATGTPWIAVLLNDIWGLLQKLLTIGGITPSGNPDTVLASDYFDGLMTVVTRPTLTVATMTSIVGVKAGQVFNVAERSTGNGGSGIWVAVVTGATPDVDLPNTINIVVGVADNLISFVLRIGAFIDIKQLGANKNLSDNSNIINKALTLSDNVIINDDEFTCTSKLTKTLTTNAKIGGSGKIVNIVSDVILEVINPVVVSTTLDGASTLDNTFLMTSVTSILPGDLMKIESTKKWDTDSVFHIAGELLQVIDVSSSTVNTTILARDTYLDLDVVKFYRPYNIDISNLSIEGNLSGTGSGQTGLDILNTVGTKLSNINVRNTSKRCIAITDCLNTVLINPFAHSTPTLAGFAYGLSVNSCDSTSVYGGSLYAGRHGVSHGGTFPARNSSYDNVNITSNPAQTQAAVDAHANTDITRFSNCRINNGVGILGRNTIFDGCIINGPFNKYIADDDYHREQYTKLINCTLTNDPAQGHALLIRLVKDTNGPAYLGDFVLDGTTINGTYTTTPAIGFKNDFVNSTVHIEKVSIINRSIVDYDSNNSGLFGIDINSPYEFIVDDLYIDNSDLTSNQKIARLEGSLGKFKRTRIKNSLISTTMSVAITIQSTSGNELFEVDGCVVKVTGSGGTAAGQAVVCKIINTEFVGLSARVWNFSSAGELQTYNNTSNLSQALTFDQVPGKHYQQKNLDNVIAYGTSAPVAGAWLRGDRLYNTTPSVGGPHAFVCVASGTPGTWEQTANLV